MSIEFNHLTQDMIDFFLSLGCKIVQYKSKIMKGLTFYTVYKPNAEIIEYLDYNKYREWG
jgi:hypothetical protein